MMNKTIQQITQKLIDLLPENEQYYLLDDLRLWGFPPFIVQRIQVELERNLAESMVPPKTDWANTQSDMVLEAWQQFVQAIRDEARLPASYAKAVIETGVADTLDMLIEPRKNIPDIIFGNDDELNYEQLNDRINAVVVYPHFATLVPRYMQRKELDTLSRSRCEQLIRRADERLTANYSPLNWAQTLDPLFDLMDDQVDPGMFRLFFEDKERRKAARIFDQKEELLNRAEFIEALSSPDWDEPERVPVEAKTERHPGNEPAEQPMKSRVTPEEVPGEYEEPVPEPTEKGPTGEGATEKESAEERKPDQSKVSASDVPEELAGEPNREEPSGEGPDREGSDREEPDGKELFIRNQGLPAGKEPAPDSGDEDSSAAETVRNGNHTQDHSLNSAFGWEEEEWPPEDEDRTEEVEEEPWGGAVDESPPEGEDPIEEEGEDSNPIWMNFMNQEEDPAREREEGAVLEGDERREIFSERNVEEDTASRETAKEHPVEKPIINLAEDNSHLWEVKKLQEQLSTGRARYIDNIFGGSERAFEESIEELAEISNWQGASKYIQKEIFQRNQVDMYSEAAIDFTDQMHNYFTENKV